MVNQRAHEASLAARIRSLEDILDHLLNEIENAQSLALSNQAQIEHNAARLRDAARAEEILRRAFAAGGDDTGPRHAARRDRHGMHVVRGSALAAAAAAVGRWSWRAGAHRAITSVALVAAAGSATVAAPSLMMGPPAPARAGIVAPHHHHRRLAAVLAPVAPGPGLAAHHARAHRPYDDDDAAVTGSGPSPSASPSSSPSPLPSASVTPAPTTSPSPGPTNSAQGTGG